MSEPFYISQTSELAHLDDSHAWFVSQRKKAFSENILKLYRMSVSDNPAGLLFEAWDHTPIEQGVLRWSWSAALNKDKLND